MTLIVETPKNRIPERSYILEVLLDDFLGLEWRQETSDRSDIRITLSNNTGAIYLPDTLFSVTDSEWLTGESMPSLPLTSWDSRELSSDILLTNHYLPLIYGDRNAKSTVTDMAIKLPVDIFGSAFFMLTRLEEIIKTDKDEHGRFPCRASFAYQENFLDRPIVDEYVEVLWSTLSTLWPQLERKQRHSQTLVSCDVDSAIHFRGSWLQFARTLTGDLIKRLSPSLAIRNLIAGLRVHAGNLDKDPNVQGLRWIMDENERYGNSVAFFVIPEITDPRNDNPVDLGNPRMRGLLNEIHERGHQIGIHPGYNTYCYPDSMARSISRLRRILLEENIHQPIIGSRQHFLRWETPTTARLLHENKLDYDSTLTFPEQPGFRCGTCHDYPLFDLLSRTKLNLFERPLVLMECSVIASRYQGLGYSDAALKSMLKLKRTCEKFNGNFTVLWHNTHFRYSSDKSFYRNLVTPS